MVADTALLDTLSPREFRAGYAEVAKYGLLGDEAFFAWLEANWQEVFAGGPAREHAIATSCRMKAAIVARDERETGERALLNLGHTFGHAFEAAAGFSQRLLHGEAVALGMVLAFEFSARQGLLPVADVARVRRHLEAVGLPTKVSQIEGGPPGIDRLMELIAQDKKVSRGKLTFILLRGIGAELHRARRRCRRGPGLSGGETRRAMLTEDWLSIAFVLLCLVGSFFFSASETALTAMSRARMLRMEKNGNPRATMVNRLIETRERMIGAILTGNNIANITASTVATSVLLFWFGDVGVLYATVIMTVLTVVFTEVLPKTLAINAPDRVALLVARPISWAVRLFGPMLIGVEAMVRWILRLVGVTGRHRPGVSVGARGTARSGRSAAPRGQRREAGPRHALGPARSARSRRSPT